MAKKNGGAVVATQDAPGTEVALPDDVVSRLAMFAQQTQQTEVAKGQFFSTQSGQLSFNKQACPNNAVEAVVVRSMHERVYYPEKWSANNPQSPLCFAFSFTGDDMVPHPNATEQQAETCAQCPHNQWVKDPSDGVSRKACKEQRRLGLMPSSALQKVEFIRDATIGYIRVPVTSVKHWQEYAQKLAGGGLPPFGVVTRLALAPDPKNQFRFVFTAVNKITDAAAIDALIARHESEAVAMSQPYEKRNEGEPAPAPTNGNGSNKF